MTTTTIKFKDAAGFPTTRFPIRATLPQLRAARAPLHARLLLSRLLLFPPILRRHHVCKPRPPPLTPSARLLRLLIHKILNPKSRHGRRPQEIRASFLNRGCCLRRSVWAGAAGAETAVTLQALAVISGTDLIHRPVQGQLGGVTPAVQGLIYIINIWAPLPSAAPYKDSARPSSRSSAHAAPGAPCTSARRGARPPCQLASS